MEDLVFPPVPSVVTLFGLPQTPENALTTEEAEGTEKVLEYFFQDFLSVLIDRGCNIQRYFQRSATFLESNNWCRPGAHRIQKCAYFSVERFLGCDWRFKHLDLRIRGRNAFGCRISYAEYDDVLPTIVERDVLLRLKESELAYTLCGNAARG